MNPAEAKFEDMANDWQVMENRMNNSNVPSFISAGHLRQTLSESAENLLQMCIHDYKAPSGSILMFNTIDSNGVYCEIHGTWSVAAIDDAMRELQHLKDTLAEQELNCEEIFR